MAVVRSGSGDFPVLSQHLWLGGQEAESTAAALAPKLRKGRDGLQKLLFDVIALEVRGGAAICSQWQPLICSVTVRRVQVEAEDLCHDHLSGCESLLVRRRPVVIGSYRALENKHASSVSG